MIQATLRRCHRGGRGLADHQVQAQRRRIDQPYVGVVERQGGEHHGQQGDQGKLEGVGLRVRRFLGGKTAATNRHKPSMAARVIAVTARKFKSAMLTLQAVRSAASAPWRESSHREGCSAVAWLTCRSRLAAIPVPEEARLSMSAWACGFRNVSRSVDGSMGGSPFKGRGPARRGPSRQDRFAIGRHVAEQAVRQRHDRLVLVAVRPKRALGDAVGVVGEEHSLVTRRPDRRPPGPVCGKEVGRAEARRPARPPSRPRRSTSAGRSGNRGPESGTP